MSRWHTGPYRYKRIGSESVAGASVATIGPWLTEGLQFNSGGPNYFCLDMSAFLPLNCGLHAVGHRKIG